MKNSVVGLILFLFSGLLYTLERIAAKISAYIAVIGKEGSYDATPTYPALTDNVLILLSLIISLLFFGASIIEGVKKLNPKDKSI